MKAIQLNPLFVKEVKTLFRGKGFPIIHNVYVLLLLVILLGILLATTNDYYNFAWRMGRQVLTVLAAFQLVCLCLIAPAITAAAMSLERDRNTYDTLMVMPLGRGRIVFYKTVSSLMFLLLLAAASTPFLAGGFVLGGITPSELAVAAVLTLAGILAAGALGLMFAALFKRTIIAVPGACLAAGVLILGTAGAVWVMKPPQTWRLANPLIALSEHMRGATAGFFTWDLPAWAPSLVYQFLLCLIFFAIATEMLKLPSQRNLAGVGLVVILTCVAIMGFDLGATVRASSVSISKGLVFHSSLVLVGLAVFVACLDPLRIRHPMRIRQAGAEKETAAAWLARLAHPGPRLTFFAVVAMVFVWYGAVMSCPPLRNRSFVLTGPPFLAMTVTGAFVALCYLVSLLRRWRYSIIPKGIALGIAAAFVFGVTTIPSWVHAADNEPTGRSVDVLLLLDPTMACRSLVYSVLKPYPYLQEFLGGAPFCIVTAFAYGVLAAGLGASAFVVWRIRRTRA